MLKLCRNTFAECKISSQKGNVEFKYVKKLQEIQDKENFKFSNLLSGSHINYKNKKNECLIGCTDSKPKCC